ncbi:erythromycin esterase family protein [Hymenobacter actinosclerus]|uniref:Erythromycin esterase n=1 Tax=Hymenobacter actinosclerus TaxID=82805 RepID=A0A1I0A177_9BACT|nr:erythromycin esterase family protein [Hymenobacter actinosclerus]SES87851.1 Erythromycin esterase [Hymenobacter actinosclerus]
MKPFLFCLLYALAGALLVPTARAQQLAALGSAASAAVFAGVPQASWQPDSDSAFALFDEAFYANQLFLLGEAHGVARVQDVDLALLKHLNVRAGVRTYVAEVDCSKAYYLNEYLRTGHDSTLRLVFRSWVAGTAQWGNAELYRKFQQIREWNRTLPANRQIRFIGLDALQDKPLAADYLAARLKGQRLRPALRTQLDSVMQLLRNDTGAAALGAVAKRSVDVLQRARQQRAATLGPVYDDVRHLLRNLGYESAGLGREQILFANFEALFRDLQLENEKLYGLWGLAHVLQSPIQGETRLLAGMIRASKLPVHDKVVSVLAMFSGCRMLYPTAGLPPAWQDAGQQTYTRTDKFNHDGPLTVLAGIEELKQRTRPGSTTLFRLDAAGAATTRQPIAVRYALGIPAGQQIQFSPRLPASAYVQYLLLVRDSKAVEPLQP